MENSGTKILLAEDNVNFGFLLREFLMTKGYNVTLCEDGEIAYDEFIKNEFDICLIDVIMPKIDGFVLAEKIKKERPNVPVIFLSGQSMQEDVLKGLKLGADDYISKPFSMEELILRIEAIMRRIKVGTIAEVEIFQLQQQNFDFNKQTLSSKGGEIKLTTKEAELLKLLCLKANHLLDRRLALKEIWDDNNYFNARSMDVYISKLRRYIDEDSDVQIINVHGKGYKLILP